MPGQVQLQPIELTATGNADKKPTPNGAKRYAAPKQPPIVAAAAANPQAAHQKNPPAKKEALTSIRVEPVKPPAPAAKPKPNGKAVAAKPKKPAARKPQTQNSQNTQPTETPTAPVEKLFFFLLVVSAALLFTGYYGFPHFQPLFYASLGALGVTACTGCCCVYEKLISCYIDRAKAERKQIKNQHKTEQTQPSNNNGLSTTASLAADHNIQIIPPAPPVVNHAVVAGVAATRIPLLNGHGHKTVAPTPAAQQQKKKLPNAEPTQHYVAIPNR